eukprot:gene14099-16211_t
MKDISISVDLDWSVQSLPLIFYRTRQVAIQMSLDVGAKQSVMNTTDDKIDIQAQKDCYFASVINVVWNNSGQPIVIDRDGLLFQHIFVYMYTCRHRLPFVLVKGSLQELVDIRREADYYNLPELVAICDQAYEEELQKWCE